MSLRTSVSRGAGLGLWMSVCGCATEKPATLSGLWEGSILCDGGGVSMVVGVETGDSSDEYDVEGLISGLSLEGVESDVELVGIWTQPQASGPQVVELDMICTVVQAGGGTYELPCDGFDELGWNGANQLEASISNFLDSGLDCELNLSR